MAALGLGPAICRPWQQGRLWAGGATAQLALGVVLAPRRRKSACIPLLPLKPGWPRMA